MVVGTVVVVFFLLWIGAEGGYAPSAWYPGGLVVLAGLAAVVLFRPQPTRSAALALLLFALFAGWCLLSITWAGARGDAWDGANRTLLYLAVYAIFALPRWRAAEAAVVVGVLAVGTAAIGFAAAIAGGSAYIDGRLAAPIGYANATGALYLTVFWPALALATFRRIHWAARPILLAAAGVSLELGVLAQSRATLLAGAAALVVYLAAARERARALAFLVPVVGVTLVALPRLLDVFAAPPAGAGRAVDAAAEALVVSALLLILAGAFVGRLEHLPRRAFLVPAAVVGIAILAVAGVSVVQSADSGASTRLASGLETGRYDLWRVALAEIQSQPLVGAGADNFAVDFVRLRRDGEEPLYPHSLILRPFSQTGIVGGVLFLALLAATAAATVRARRRDPLAGAVVAGTLAAAAYWVVHGSLDWLWEIPAMTALVLALLGLAAGLAARPSERRLSWTAVAVVWAAVLAAGVSFAFPGLSALEVERAVEIFPRDPELAFERLDRARGLNPLSERADVIAASLALRAGEPERARSALLRALDRNPDDWQVQLQLAALDGARGDRSSAAAHVARARALNPRGRTVALAERTLAAGAGWAALSERLDERAVRSPLGRRSVDCRPVTGIAGRCTAAEGGR